MYHNQVHINFNLLLTSDVYDQVILTLTHYQPVLSQSSDAHAVISDVDRVPKVTIGSRIILALEGDNLPVRWRYPIHQLWIIYKPAIRVRTLGQTH